MKKRLDKSNLINIGFVSKSHGFNGELLLAIENGEAEDFTEADFFFIELEGKPVPFYVEELKLRGDSIIAKLEDVNTEAEAKKYSGKKVFAEGSEVDSTENEVNWESLIGYTVFDEAHGKLGVLEGIEEYPQQIIAICTVNGKEVLFPLNEDLISSIDDEKKELHLRLPEGLIDIYLES